ncbi:MAG TPA: DUF4340 domain-containing protein, partial [Thiolinea sp.]|nr:DUF4340 domain-containing protein [Thiolinea sp.]
MKIRIGILAVLALLQLGLVAYTHLNGPQVASTSPTGRLLTFDRAQVDGLVIRGGAAAGEQASGSNTVSLLRKDGQWQTADGFPASQGKVDSLLDKLSALQHGLAVGVSEDALRRFKVSGEDFERHVVLKKGDTELAGLYLGSGAGARQSHVRLPGTGAVYTADIGSYDVPDTEADWQDKEVLQVPDAQVKALKLAGLTLVKEAGGTDQDAAASRAVLWQADPLPDGKLVNQAAVNDNLSSLLNLRFTQVLGKEAKAEYGLDQPVLTLTLEREGGSREYTFSKLSTSDNYVLKVSDREEYFEVPAYVVTTLVENLTPDQLLMTPVAEAPAVEAPAVEAPAVEAPAVEAP